MRNTMNGTERPRLQLVPPQTPLQRGGEVVAQQRPQEHSLPKFWQNDPTISPIQKRRLEQQDAMLDRAEARFWQNLQAQRVREEAVWAQHMARYGLPPEAGFMDFYNLFEAQRKEKAAKGQLPDRTKPAPNVSQKLNVDPSITLTDDLRIQREREVGRELNEQLTKEIQDSRAMEAAQFVRRNIWKDDEQSLRSYAKPISGIDVQVTDAGEIQTRSFAGVALKHEVDSTIDTLFIGIGYVGDTRNMPQDLRQNFTQEELDRGIKVYLLERTTKTQTGETERYTYAFPYVDPKAIENFVDYSLDEAHDIDDYYTSFTNRRGTQQNQAAA